MTSPDLSKLKVLVIDTPDGISVDHAVRLGRDFGKVWYAQYSVESFPLFKNQATGIGMEEIEKVERIQPYADKADLICFFDVGFGSEAESYRDRGHSVFSGGIAEFLEEDRGKARKLQSKLGMLTQKTEEIKGVADLEKYLKSHKDVWVKVNKFRGDVKSFYAKDFDCVKQKMALIRAAFGPYADDIDFLVEESIHDAIETGFDGFHNGKDLLRPCMWGLEVDHAYLARWDKVLPPLMEDVIEAMNPVFRKLGLRGSLSTEQRALTKKKSYVIDWTIRYAYPLSLIFTEGIVNYSEVVYAVACGDDVAIEPYKEYAACAPVYTQAAEKEWIPLIIKGDHRDRIKFQGVMYGDGFYHCVKGSQNGATIIGFGDSPEECVEEIKENAEYIEADGLEKETIDVLDKIIKDTDKLRDMGIEF